MPRERYQDPTVRQNKNGSFYIKVWMDALNEEGNIERRQKRIVLGPASIGKREAERLKREAMATINRASYVIQAQIPFGEMVRRYEDYHLSRIADSTRDKYESHLKNHIRPAFSNFQMYEITRERVYLWLDAKRKAGLSHNTCLDIRNVLSSIFTVAKELKLWNDDNPIAGMRFTGGQPAREQRKLTDDQTRRLLAALPQDVRTMVSVSLFCTLRVSELLGLQEKHLDFESGLIEVAQRYYRGRLGQVKTKRSRRRVPMGYLSAELKALCMGDPERFVFQIKTRPQWGNLESVCRDDRDLLQHFIRPAAKEIGAYWEGFGWHSFRREAVTALSAELGTNQAMRMAGHSKADMSLHYTLADQEAQDRAVRARQERLLGKIGGDVQ